MIFILKAVFTIFETGQVVLLQTFILEFKKSLSGYRYGKHFIKNYFI